MHNLSASYEEYFFQAWQLFPVAVILGLKKSHDDYLWYTAGGKNVPYIWNTEILTVLQWPANKSIKDRFRTLLQLVEEYEKAITNKTSKFFNDDSEKFFGYWDTLVTNAKKDTIRALSSKNSSTKGLRHSYAHCNFYNSSQNWARNRQNYAVLKTYLTPDEETKVNKIDD
ncbi:unnamed protein product [Rotaria sp. Silwood1]|nr:unnamed protein product [Rotaria sp. Silwood1]